MTIRIESFDKFIITAMTSDDRLRFLGIDANSGGCPYFSDSPSTCAMFATFKLAQDFLRKELYEEDAKREHFLHIAGDLSNDNPRSVIGFQIRQLAGITEHETGNFSAKIR